MFRFILILTSVCVVAALVLGGTYVVTKPLIAQQEEKQKKEALEAALPDADKYDTKTFDGKEYYEGYKGGKLIGYCIPATGDGYAGPIQMLVGVGPDGKIAGVEVLSQNETPGLGARCVEIKRGDTEPWFLKQFKGKSVSGLNLKNIDAITGSTITSEAIISGVKKSISEFLDKVKR